MDLKKTLFLIFTVVMGVNFLIYTFLTYTLYNDATNSSGTDKVSSQKMFYAIKLILYMAQFGITAILAMKK